VTVSFARKAVFRGVSLLVIYVCHWREGALLFSEDNYSKLKVPLGLTKYHTMKTYPLLNQTQHHEVWGSGGIAARILSPGAKWR